MYKIIQRAVKCYVLDSISHFSGNLPKCGLSPKPRTNTSDLDPEYCRQLANRKNYSRHPSESKLTYEVFANIDLLLNIIKNILSFESASGLLSSNTLFRSLICCLDQLNQEPSVLTIHNFSQLNNRSNFRKKYNLNFKFLLTLRTCQELSEFLKSVENSNQNLLDKITDLHLCFNVDSSTHENVFKILLLLQSNLHCLYLHHFKPDINLEINSFPKLSYFSCYDMEGTLVFSGTPTLHKFACQNFSGKLMFKDALAFDSFACIAMKGAISISNTPQEPFFEARRKCAPSNWTGILTNTN